MNDEKPALPRLLLIADGFASGRKGRDVGSVWMAVEAAVWKARVGLVMLRDHEAMGHEFETAADLLARSLRVRRPRVQLVINSREETALIQRSGLHVGARGPAVADVVWAFNLLGFSAHTPEEAAQAARDGADYVTFSPIFPTSTKPDHPGVGLEALSEAARAASPIPVFALGGITPGRVKECLDAGAYGVAVLSGILDAPDPVAAANDYQAALESYA